MPRNDEPSIDWEATRFVRAPGARPKTVADGVAVYVREQRAIHVLNPTARLIFEYLEEPADVEELMLAMREATGASPPQLEADLREILETLVGYGVVAPAS